MVHAMRAVAAVGVGGLSGRGARLIGRAAALRVANRGGAGGEAAEETYLLRGRGEVGARERHRLLGRQVSS